MEEYELRDEDLLELECRMSFDFFWKEATADKGSPGYGLIADRAPHAKGVCSVASVGFGLTALAIAAERGWIGLDEARERAGGTVRTLLDHAEQVNGFFFHFLDMNTGKRVKNCEVSVIDTAIAVTGAITAGEYFGSEVRALADILYRRVNWPWYLNPATNQFYMGYTPERGFFGAWDVYAEQFMMYFLAAASPTYPVNMNTFYDFQRLRGRYGDLPEFVYTWAGSLFTFQFSHAWFDLRNKVDGEGYDWWENSVIATLTNRQFCMDLSDSFRTFGPNAWGLTACDGPRGYSGRYGCAPSGYHNDQHHPDGTVPPAGAAGSIVFTSDESIAALRHYKTYPELWGPYGFRDAYNLDVSPTWFADDYIGIDKGITLLMIENYRSGFVWDTFMRSPYASLGLRRCGLRDKAGQAEVLHAL